MTTNLETLAAEVLKTAMVQARLDAEDSVLVAEDAERDRVDAATEAWVDLEVRCRLARLCLRWPQVTVDRYGARHYEDPAPLSATSSATSSVTEVKVEDEERDEGQAQCEVRTFGVTCGRRTRLLCDRCARWVCRRHRTNMLCWECASAERLAEADLEGGAR